MPRSGPPVKEKLQAKRLQFHPETDAGPLSETAAPSPLTSRASAPLKGRIRVPGDKSISHRALILGALSLGETVVEDLLEGEDVLNTAAVLRALGARIERDRAGHWRIRGVGVGGFAEPTNVLDHGNSGTGVRLMMGAVATSPITATFTARRPERVKSLTLIDPAGARAIALTPLVKVLQLPLIAESVLGLVGGEPFVRTIARDFFDPRLVEHFQSHYRIQMQYRGFLRAVLSTMRNGLLASFIETYRQIGKMDKPVLLFWGRDDRTVPFEHSLDLRAALPHVEFRVIENCGHIPHYERPAEFNPLLLEFLQRR